VLTELAHEQRHRVGHAGEVGLESQLGRRLPVRIGSVRIAIDLVCVSNDGRDLDPARLELAAQKRELVVVEIELDGLRLELDRIDDAVVLGLVDEALQLVRVKRRFDLILLPSSSDCAEPPSLEALGTAAARNRSLHAGVRGVTPRAHLEHELVAHGAGGELVPARATTHVGRDEVGVVPLHSNVSSRG
jgi:hypothetical protein